MAFDQFTPQATDQIIDPTTGQFTEIGRRLVRLLSQAVGALAPLDAAYWTSHADPTLTSEQNIGALATGYLRITSGLGIATPATVATIPSTDITGLPTLTSGTYTPTLTNVANLAASTAYVCQYLRVGNTVTVSGKVDVDPIAAATDTQLGISLPIASTFTLPEQCGGVAWAPTVTSEGGAILADVANARATLQWKSVDVTNAARAFTFTYRVL